MSTTLLLGIDGSDGGRRALDFAIAVARTFDAKLVVATVIEWSAYSFNTPEENAERHKRREEELSRARSHILEPAMKRLKDEGMDAVADVRHGHAAEVMIDLAKEHQATHIVVGRRGHSKLKALMFGSVSGSLVQTSPVPVTVVP